MTVRIVAFHGPAGAGKDECGKHLVAQGWTRLGMADPLKRGLEAMGFGSPQTISEKETVIEDLGVTWRHCAQTLGTEWGRNMIHPDIWIIMAAKYMRDNASARFVFTDLRFKNEAEMVRKAGGLVVHIRGRRGGTGNDAHQSEQALPLHPGDLTFHNDVEGLDALQKNLTALLAQYV